MYCERPDLTDYVLDAYLTAAEEQKPNIVENSIKNVSGEIDDALRRYYILPLTVIPATIKRICAVLAAYRVVGAITTFVDSESSSGNEWIPLQTNYKDAKKDLAAIRDGKMDLELERLGAEPSDDDTEIAVITRPSTFGNLEGY